MSGKDHIVTLSLTVKMTEMDGSHEQSAELVLDLVCEALEAAGIDSSDFVTSPEATLVR